MGHWLIGEVWLDRKINKWETSSGLPLPESVSSGMIPSKISKTFSSV
jgi:hypothetical protein